MSRGESWGAFGCSDTVLRGNCAHGRCTRMFTHVREVALVIMRCFGSKRAHSWAELEAGTRIKRSGVGPGPKACWLSLINGRVGFLLALANTSVSNQPRNCGTPRSAPSQPVAGTRPRPCLCCDRSTPPRSTTSSAPCLRGTRPGECAENVWGYRLRRVHWAQVKDEHPS